MFMGRAEEDIKIPAPQTQRQISRPRSTSKESRHRSASLTRNSGNIGAHTTKPGIASRVSMGASSTGLGPKLDLDSAAAENKAFMLTRSTERQEMVALNDRLALYIEEVRTLESKNKQLDMEIEAFKNSYVRPSGLRQVYESQLKELNREAHQMKEQRDLSLAAKHATLGQLDTLKSKYDDAVEDGKKAELDIENLRPDVDKATSGRIALERQIDDLEATRSFLQKVHKEEMEELMQQIYAVLSAGELTFGLPDLSSDLTQIEFRYESIAAKNLQEMETWYGTKFQVLNSASTKHIEHVRSVREELTAYKKDVLNKERELEAMKTRNEYLEAQMCDAVAKYRKKEENLQEHIEEMKLGLKVTKEKMALLLREYQNLLSVKMTLEIEITTYRKLMEGEAVRLSSVLPDSNMTGGRQLVTSFDKSSNSDKTASGRVDDVASDTQTDDDTGEQATESRKQKQEKQA